MKNLLSWVLACIVGLSSVPAATAEAVVAAEPAESVVPFEQLSHGEALRSFSQQLNPGRSANEVIRAAFSFDGVDQDYGIIVFMGNVEFVEGMPENPDFSIRIKDSVWQDVVYGKVSILGAITENNPGVYFSGSKVIFLKFLELFDKTPNTKVVRY